MVLTEETTTGSASTDNGPSASASAGAGQSSSSASQPSSSAPGLMEFVTRDKISLLLFLTRTATIAFTLMFIFPFFGYDASTCYQKALLACGATSALKLHQRMSGVPFQFNRVYFGNLMIEDSFHYLLYAIIFLNSFPITIVLMPITAFALTHNASYVISVVNTVYGPQATGLAKKAATTIYSKNQDILRFIAITEIMLGPTIIVMIFTGRSGIFVPFIYYRFISMRYQSRRNTHSKTMFHELRMTAEHYISQPSCPGMVRNLVQRIIGVIIRLAPAPNAI